MEKQFTPPETAVFSNVTWGKRGGGQKSGGWDGAIRPSPFFILMTGLREERVGKERQGMEEEEEERWTGGAWRGLGQGFPP